MARGSYKSKARSLRDDSEQIPATMPALHRIWLVCLLDALVHAGYGFYVGKWGVAGKVTIRVYIDDDAVETFLLARDDPGKWAADTAKQLFSPGLAEEVVRRGHALAAQERPSAVAKA